MNEEEEIDALVTITWRGSVTLSDWGEDITLADLADLEDFKAMVVEEGEVQIEREDA